MHHERLLSPGQIGTMAVRNRIVMPAMDQNSCTSEGEITDLNVAHYEARARGGAGLLILETSSVAYPYGSTSRHQPALSDDRYIPGLARLADAVHRHDGKVVVQMCHHGKTAMYDVAEGREQLVPSMPLPPSDPAAMAQGLTLDEMMRMAAVTGGKLPSYREATAADLSWVVEQFAAAARRVQRAGFDGAEIHAAHGYLLSTFLSPAFNRRTDDYGGSVHNRARLLCDVIRAIRAEAGGDFAIIVRLDGNEYNIENGTGPALAAQYATLAEAAGADAIHVSATSSGSSGLGFTDGPLPWLPLQYVDFAKVVKAAVTIPVIAVGRIMPDDAEALLGRGDVCDFVSMGRQLLADPDIPAKLEAGTPELVRTCINCFVCVAQNFWDGKPVCAVNAELGHYDEAPLQPASEPRHVVVVGGGPGGMEVARVAAIRGHRVTLLERSKHLGGTARFSSLTTPMNAELVRYLSNAIRAAGVDVRLEAPATATTVAGLSPDVVVVATGAKRTRPAVPGADLDHVYTGDDLRALMTGDDPAAGRKLAIHKRLAVAAGRRAGLTDDMGKVRELSKRWMPIGHDVVVIGGGLVGVELAEFLAERGRNVTVLEEGDALGVEMAHPRRWRAVHEARTHGVRFFIGAALVEVQPDGVVYRDTDGEHRVPADAVVLATGVHADHTLAAEISAHGIEAHVVGDAAKVGYIEGAIRSAYVLAKEL
jgi:2,4-dienoyl-CoA reductase-like NADH-dependent reductase (Old Yellow Enzyme family)/thioredoxin reductase